MALSRVALPTVGLIAVLALLGNGHVDLALQDRLYNQQSHTWFLTRDNDVLRELLYHWPKYVIVTFGILMVGATVGPQRWRARLGLDSASGRRRLMAMLSVLAAAPLLIGGLKSVTGVPSPFQLDRYGGTRTHVALFEPTALSDRSERPGRSFPAGHASGGFALAGLALLARTRRRQLIGLLVGATVGTTMGVYQMLMGSHFLSHTLTTVFIVWVLIEIARLAFRVPTKAAPSFK